MQGTAAETCPTVLNPANREKANKSGSPGDSGVVEDPTLVQVSTPLRPPSSGAAPCALLAMRLLTGHRPHARGTADSRDLFGRCFEAAQREKTEGEDASRRELDSAAIDAPIKQQCSQTPVSANEPCGHRTFAKSTEVQQAADPNAEK